MLRVEVSARLPFSGDTKRCYGAPPPDDGSMMNGPPARTRN